MQDEGVPGMIDDASTMWELVERRAAATPEAPALLDPLERRVSFLELKQWAERVAAGLLDLGVGAGTIVSLQLPTRIETVVLSLALARLGAVQNPILHLYRERELGVVLRKMAPAFYACPGWWKGVDFPGMVEVAGTGLDVQPRVINGYERLAAGDPATLPPPPAAPSAQDVRWIYFTSGTTSEPKGVRHTDATLLAGAISVATALGMHPPDVFLIPFPLTHIGGANAMVFMLAAGLPCVLVEAFVAAEAVDLCRRYQVTLTGGSTAFYQAFLGEQRKRPDEPIIPSLRLLMGGGAPKPPELFYEVKRELGIPIAHGFGMTEVSTATLGIPSDTDEQLACTDGAPLPGTEVRIVRSDGQPAAADENGEIRIRGPLVCKGYTDERRTSEAFDDEGYLRTGDVGHLRHDGHLVVTGRLKDVIIRKGENISAREIEDLLYQHPKVGDVAVIGLPDPDRGERVCAVIERGADREVLTMEEMVAYLRAAGLMIQKIPEQLEVVDELPRNQALRKVIKFQLRDRFAAVPWP